MLQVGELPDREVGIGEVLVSVKAAGINPSDTKHRAGWRGMTMPAPRVVPGHDGAGIIAAVGSGVPESRIGQRVWIYGASLDQPWGTSAELVAVDSAKAVELGDGATFAQGACLGVPAMTAHRALFADGAIEGQTILVTGAAGGVGIHAVSLAKWGGARVVATVSDEAKAHFAMSAGADAVVDYRESGAADRVLDAAGGPVDRVVDMSFGANLDLTLAVLKPNGIIATYGSDAVPRPEVYIDGMITRGVTVQFPLVYILPDHAREQAIGDIRAAVAASALPNVVTQRFALDDVAAAHEAVERGHLMGKIILEI